MDRVFHNTNKKLSKVLRSTAKRLTMTTPKKSLYTHEQNILRALQKIAKPADGDAYDFVQCFDAKDDDIVNFIWDVKDFHPKLYEKALMEIDDPCH